MKLNIKTAIKAMRTNGIDICRQKCGSKNCDKGGSKNV